MPMLEEIMNIEDEYERLEALYAYCKDIVRERHKGQHLTDIDLALEAMDEVAKIENW